MSRAAYVAEWKKANPLNVMLLNVKTRAKKEGKVFSLTPGDVSIPDVCPILGIELVAAQGRGRKDGNSPTLRMIDPAKGYVAGNCMVVSRAAYMQRPITATGQLSDAELETLALDLVRLIGAFGATPDSVNAVMAAFKRVAR